MQNFLIKLIHSTNEIHITLTALSLEDAMLKAKEWLENNFSFESFGYKMSCEVC